jgi:hypothetical protein
VGSHAPRLNRKGRKLKTNVSDLDRATAADRQPCKLRGREKVNAQWHLYCMVHNIEKLAHSGWRR